MNIHRLRCAEVWGGIKDIDQDVCSAGLNASISCTSSAGGRGGDIYYFSLCDDDRFTRIALADVTGHGEAAGELSQWLYDAMRERMNDLDGAALLSDLNRLATDHGFNAITTAAVIGYYQTDSNLHFTYAGHYPILVRRKGESEWTPARVPPKDSKFENLPLGVAPNAEYLQVSMPLCSGDRIFLFTDGLIEAPGLDDSLFGEERLKAVLRAADGSDLGRLKRSVIAELHKHTGGRLGHDDVTLMAVEIR